MKDPWRKNILKEPKHQTDGIDSKKILRLQVIVKELRKDINRALDKKYFSNERFSDLERENADLRGRMGRMEQALNDIIANPTPKISDPFEVKDESEKIEIELVKLDYFKPRMGNC